VQNPKVALNVLHRLLTGRQYPLLKKYRYTQDVHILFFVVLQNCLLFNVLELETVGRIIGLQTLSLEPDV